MLEGEGGLRYQIRATSFQPCKCPAIRYKYFALIDTEGTNNIKTEIPIQSNNLICTLTTACETPHLHNDNHSDNDCKKALTKEAWS